MIPAADADLADSADFVAASPVVFADPVAVDESPLGSSHCRNHVDSVVDGPAVVPEPAGPATVSLVGSVGAVPDVAVVDDRAGSHSTAG